MPRYFGRYRVQLLSQSLFSRPYLQRKVPIRNRRNKIVTYCIVCNGAREITFNALRRNFMFTGGNAGTNVTKTARGQMSPGGTIRSSYSFVSTSIASVHRSVPVSPTPFILTAL